MSLTNLAALVAAIFAALGFEIFSALVERSADAGEAAQLKSEIVAARQQAAASRLRIAESEASIARMDALLNG